MRPALSTGLEDGPGEGESGGQACGVKFCAHCLLKAGNGHNQNRGPVEVSPCMLAEWHYFSPWY